MIHLRKAGPRAQTYLTGRTRTFSLSVRRSACGSLVGFLGLIAVVALGGPAFGQQNPCAEQGPDCRPLKPAEITALKERILALRAALPVPDPARWAVPHGVGDAYTMPFIAELNAGAPMISASWPAGAFTERNEVHFVYEGVTKAAAGQMQAALNRMEVLATLLPHAYLVDEVDGRCVDVSDPEATNIEKTATFLSWEANEGTVLTLIFGPRTCKMAETERVDKPAPNLAPVKCVRLEITGPNRAEVAALKKKIDRKAFEALLGPTVK